MSELVVVGFDNVNEADRALNELTRLQREYLVDLEDAVIAMREPDGKVRLKQSVGADAATGGLWGGMIGSLFGLLLLNPILGFITGAAFGAGAGALSGKLADYGIDDDFIRSIGQTLQPNTSALFVLVRKMQPEKVLAELNGFRGRVILSSLSPEQERRLLLIAPLCGRCANGGVTKTANHCTIHCTVAGDGAHASTAGNRALARGALRKLPSASTEQNATAIVLAIYDIGSLLSLLLPHSDPELGGLLFRTQQSASEVEPVGGDFEILLTAVATCPTRGRSVHAATVSSNERGHILR